jgi:hypothetical protein
MKMLKIYMGHNRVAKKKFGLISNDHGNRTWQAACGCLITSGAGAYGTTGSGRQIERCSRHAYDQDGNLIQD